MTDLDIANIALGRIGQSPLAILGGNQGVGLLTIQSYSTAKDALLRAIPWNFARKWVNLAQLAAAPLGMDIAPNSAGPGLAEPMS